MTAALLSAVLHWYSSDDISWRTLGSAPSTNHGFTEKCTYFFKQPAPGWSLYVDDEQLQSTSGQPDVWEWRPLFFAGEVTAELKRPDKSSAAVFLLDVGPDPRKLGRELFYEMVEELWAEDPTLVIGEEPATTPLGELGASQNPWVAFVRLRRYLPEFLKALSPIRDSPRRTLRVRRERVPLQRVRRVDHLTATSILRSASVSTLVGRIEQDSRVSSDIRVDVPVNEETIDSAANRGMLALVLALVRRTRTLLDRLQSEVDTEIISETRTALVQRWPSRKGFLHDAIAQLGLVLRRFPFKDLRRPEFSAAGLTAIAADPIYSRAWGRGWRSLKEGFQSDPNTERMWMSPSWEIYERWCFLKIGRLLACSTPSWRWRLVHGKQRWIGIGPDVEADFRLQPTFKARSSAQDGVMWSISKERIPDLVLSTRRAGVTRFLVMDAKYRTSRFAVLDAMASAHIYQDSLRIGNRRPDSTLLVVPSVSKSDWLASPEFHSEHRVGAFELGPGQNASLPDVIQSFLLTT